MKPDWKDAPEWAKFLAMDEDGTWCWYEIRPSRLTTSFDTNGRYLYAFNGYRDWKASLESRPNA